MIQVSYGSEFFPVAVPLREKVARLETELLKMPQADIVTEHLFLDGQYERKITIPPWTILTGAEHKTPYRVRLERGTIAVNTDTEVKVLTGPLEFDAPAGAQRVGRVFGEEVVWVDVYSNPDNCTDILELEDRLYVVPDIGLASSRTEAQKSRVDFEVFKAQLGVTQAQLDRIVQVNDDLIDMPGGYAVELRDSMVHGQGLFATAVFRPGDIVCPGRIEGRRTPGGRFINHSNNSNIEPVKVGDDIWAIASKRIDIGDELLVDYRASVRVNFGITLQGESS